MMPQGERGTEKHAACIFADATSCCARRMWMFHFSRWAFDEGPLDEAVGEKPTTEVQTTAKK
jgi:hypothetical protein